MSEISLSIMPLVKSIRHLPARIVWGGASFLCLEAAVTVSSAFFAICMAFVAFVLGWLALFRPDWLQTGIDQATIDLINDDPDSAFVTDQNAKVCYTNATAMARFGDCDGRSLHDIFENMMADPASLIQRMISDDGGMQTRKEHIVTRRAHFRMSMTPLRKMKLLWRLDELGGQSEIQNESFALPILSVASDGVISHQNKAFRDLMVTHPNSLRDAFDTFPVIAGKLNKLMTGNGLLPVFVAEIKGLAGRRDLVVVPSAQAAPRMRLDVGWDAIEDLPVPLLKVSVEGDVLASNREARHLLGREYTEKTRFADLLDGLGRPITDWLREAAEGRGGHVSQFLRGRGENQDTFVQVTLNSAGGADDPHLIAVLNDVTELKTLEAQFVQSQKMQAIGQLAGGVAHDFNNLLTAISGHCDLLLLRHDEGDQNFGDLIQIHQNANRAASLVGQLLAFSRKQNLQPEIIDLRDTLSDLTHLLNRLVGEKVTLTLHHDPALAQIKADKRQLEQVLMNLVVNARDAMLGKGEIRVETENMVLTKPMIKDRAVVPPGAYVVVKVIDEGHGIPPEKLSKIFEPFYTTKRTGEGTGLGLSTAYGIVKQTGGFIFADSEVGSGTEFSLLFPSYDLPVSTPVLPIATTPQLTTSHADGVVLLVEDEAPVRAFASRALQLRGYTVLEADCAEAALAMLEDPELQVDLFVSDVIMPGMDGPTWVRQALEARPHIKVVFVSGYAEDAFGDEQSRIANAVFLAKPFSLNALTQTVESQLASTP